MSTNKPASPATLLAQAGHFIDEVTGAVTPAIHPAVTFARGDDHQLIGPRNYSRHGNPNSDLVERLAAELDGGAAALLFSSGLAAIAALLETVRMGQHIAAPKIMYFGAQAWMTRIAERRGIGLTLYDAAEEGAIARAVRPGETAILWVETPANPSWVVTDIAAAAQIAHDAGAILGVDSTVAPPVTTRPLDLGADIVFHSATKYYGGHSDALAGLLVTRRDDALWQEINEIRMLTGGLAGPHTAWLLVRGMRTLALRYKAASTSALRFAQHFHRHHRVEKVLYPGLETHPGHAIAARQMLGGFGGMLSVLLPGGADEAIAVVTRLKVFLAATSLGGVESLVEHRATVEGPDSTVPANLLRFSIGIEDCDDLIADFEQALG
ncbi:MAG: trans-sulfuration enzyme family protein [Alphaproteobacteria bacterium]